MLPLVSAFELLLSTVDSVDLLLSMVDSVGLEVVSAIAADEVLSEGTEPPGVDRMGRVWEDGNEPELSVLAACW